MAAAIGGFVTDKFATDGLYVIEPDRHAPFECMKYRSILYQVIKSLQPRGYINLGDFVDWWQLSTFDKDPARLRTIQDDLEIHNKHLTEIGRLLPSGAIVHQLAGNHEDRLRRYIWRHAPKLFGIVPDLQRLLDFPTRNAVTKVRWIWHPIDNWQACKIGNTVIHHGHFFNKHTAVTNLDRYRGVNLIHGHTHRVQYAHNGDFWCATIGHASDPSQTNHNPVPVDWQQAIGLLTVYRGQGALEIVTVDNGAASVRGRRFVA